VIQVIHRVVRTRLVQIQLKGISASASASNNQHHPFGGRTKASLAPRKEKQVIPSVLPAFLNATSIVIQLHPLAWVLALSQIGIYSLTLVDLVEKDSRLYPILSLFLAIKCNFDTNLIGNRGGNLRSSCDPYLLW
jgi:hypothetical protein